MMQTMRQTLTRAFVALALAAVMARPAYAANKEHQQLMADIRMLQEQAQQLQNLIGSLNTTLGEALRAVNARLDEQTGTTRKAFADQKLVIDALTSDLRVVREKVDDNNVRIGSISQEVDALRQSLQQQNASRPPPSPDSPDAAGPGTNGPGDGTTPPAPAATSLAIGTSPQRLYDQALSNYWSGLWDLAIEGFTSYIRSFPRSDMADDAQVAIGNSYLQDGKNDKAVEAYDLAIRTYPNGNAIPEAYYKKGLALKNLRQLDRAREAFEYVAKTYPDSDAGRLAKQQITTPAVK
jgi:tol-pal system protein YbgF